MVHAYGSLAQDIADLMATGAYSDTCLGEYAALAEVARRRLTEAVQVARLHEPVKPWAQIGAELGVTAQAAQQRFGKVCTAGSV